MSQFASDTIGCPCRPDHRRRGFTLVECLVVVAVIILLVALLIPVVKKARWQAQMANCVSNQRQLVLVATTYHATHGSFPPSLSWGGAVNKANPNYSWPNTYNYHSEDDGVLGAWLYDKKNRWLVTYLGKYLNDPKVLTCPAGPDPAKVLQEWYLNPPQQKADSITQGSYALFWGGFYRSGTDTVNGKLVQIWGPKKMGDGRGRLLTADAAMGIEGWWWSPHMYGQPPREVQYSAHSAQLTLAGVWLRPRSRDGNTLDTAWPEPDLQINVGFVDGSVQTMAHRDLHGISRDGGTQRNRTVNYVPATELQPSRNVTLP